VRVGYVGFCGLVSAGSRSGRFGKTPRVAFGPVLLTFSLRHPATETKEPFWIFSHWPSVRFNTNDSDSSVNTEIQTPHALLWPHLLTGCVPAIVTKDM